jgi:hypothetical protein
MAITNWYTVSYSNAILSITDSGFTVASVMRDLCGYFRRGSAPSAFLISPIHSQTASGAHKCPICICVHRQNGRTTAGLSLREPCFGIASSTWRIQCQAHVNRCQMHVNRCQMHKGPHMSIAEPGQEWIAFLQSSTRAVHFSYIVTTLVLNICAGATARAAVSAFEDRRGEDHGG